MYISAVTRKECGDDDYEITKKVFSQDSAFSEAGYLLL